jgi:hypothetical protein
MFLQLALQKQNKSFSINNHRIVTDPELKLKTLNIDHMPSQSKDKGKYNTKSCSIWQQGNQRKRKEKDI